MSAEKWSHELQAKIIARAWKDTVFKNKLLKNPKEAFKEYGLAWGKDIIITTLEETSNQLYFTLPKAPIESSTLSNAKLEKLAAARCYTGTNNCSVSCVS